MQRPEPSQLAGAEQRGFFALLRALADSGVDLAHNTAQMAASEGRVVLQRVVLRLALLVAALLVAAVGLTLSLFGVSLLVAHVTGMDEWLAFAIVGIGTLGTGVAFAVRATGRLSSPDLAFPATLAEFNADVEMLRNGRDAPGDEAP
ncbi:MAG: phage holin family protein [Planctomycetes bacterium]|nr:phage holin family protein [Planctomycetota bacterium]